MIGGRHLVFATIYGMRLYWGLGLALTGAACLLGILPGMVPAQAGVVAGAGIEMGFGVACLMVHRGWVRHGVPAARAGIH